jgi:molybdopterin-containing oxidoreductase family membrane subunit
LDQAPVLWIGRLLAVLVLIAGYFVLIENAHRLYAHESRAAERFFLFGGAHSLLFWGGLLLVGSVLPVLILFHRKAGASIRWVAVAAVMVVAGVLCERYLIVIPGLAYPPDLFPGWTITQSPIEEGIATYAVSLHELLQALGVVALMGLLFLWGLRTLRLLPGEAGRG